MILSRERLYERKEPSKDAKLFIIYCEGEKRENQYFKYFLELSSQMKLEIEPPIDGRTSPLDLYNRAIHQIIKPEENANIKYELTPDDEVWFVIDTDNWGSEIIQLRENIKDHKNWLVAQSNPCFEVWLFYHFFPFEAFADIETSKGWKHHLHTKNGGFNSAKHPIFIQNAIENAKSKFEEEIKIGSTEVFKLAESFYPLIKDKIDEALEKTSKP